MDKSPNAPKSVRLKFTRPSVLNITLVKRAGKTFHNAISDNVPYFYIRHMWSLGQIYRGLKVPA